MSTFVEQFGSEPIIFIAFDGYTEQQDVINAFQQTADLLQSGPVYRIIDIQQATLSLVDVVSVIHDLTKGLPESSVVFVGRRHLGAAAHKLGVRFFDRMDNALVYANAQVAQQTVPA